MNCLCLSCVNVCMFVLCCCLRVYFVRVGITSLLIVVACVYDVLRVVFPILCGRVFCVVCLCLCSYVGVFVVCCALLGP